MNDFPQPALPVDGSAAVTPAPESGIATTTGSVTVWNPAGAATGQAPDGPSSSATPIQTPSAAPQSPARTRVAPVRHPGVRGPVPPVAGPNLLPPHPISPVSAYPAALAQPAMPAKQSMGPGARLVIILAAILASTLVAVLLIVVAARDSSSSESTSYSSGSDSSTSDDGSDYAADGSSDASTITDAATACSIEVTAVADYLIDSNGDYYSISAATDDDSQVASMGYAAYSSYVSDYNYQGVDTANANLMLAGTDSCSAAGNPLLTAGEENALYQLVTNSTDTDLLYSVEVYATY